jgi:transcriptional regulator with XRE-family HTH domain
VYKKGLSVVSDLYERIEKLCKSRNITITTMCKESGASRGSLTDLKAGRKQNLSIDTLSKIAIYFGVTVDHLAGTETKNAPAEDGKRTVTDEDIKFALFGGDGEITDEMYKEVLNFAAFVKNRESNK